MDFLNQEIGIILVINLGRMRNEEEMNNNNTQ